MRSQIGQRRTFTKLILFIHFGRWNLHSINPLNPIILTWQSQINLDQGPTTTRKLNQVNTNGQQNLIGIYSIKNNKIVHLNQIWFVKFLKPHQNTKEIAMRFIIGQTRSKDLGEKISQFLDI